MKFFRCRELKRGFGALLLLCVGLVVFGCQSQTAPEVRYYLLQPTVDHASQGRVEIGRVKLPGYLQGSNLMLAVSEYEIRPAQYHLWSEPLEDGVRRVLEAELAARPGKLERDAAAVRVDLEIDIFHATESGRVVLKGAWRLRGEGTQVHGYSINSSIEDDGYAAAVRAHVSALSELAEDIASAF